MSPELATTALRSELLKAAATEDQVIVGIDSPPSIARQFIAQRQWVKWVAKFSEQYPTPAAFRQATSLPKMRSGKKSCMEPKQVTVVKHKAPPAPKLTDVQANLVGHNWSVWPIGAEGILRRAVHANWD